jgi:hypothetical protein
MADDTRGDSVTRVARTFPLSDWVELLAGGGRLAEKLGAGMPLPRGVDWSAYTVQLIERLLTAEDFADDSMMSGQGLTWEGGAITEELNPDGTLRHFEIRGERTWRHVRTVITHPDVAARLEWQWDGRPFGQIAIVGLEVDPDPERSCRVLVRAIPLLRDYEWRGQAKPGRPELTDEEVRADLQQALARCQKMHDPKPSLPRLAAQHERRFESISDEAGISESALRGRMLDHPAPFRELVPWVKSRKKR